MTEYLSVGDKVEVFYHSNTRTDIGVIDKLDLNDEELPYRVVSDITDYVTWYAANEVRLIEPVKPKATTYRETVLQFAAELRDIDDNGTASEFTYEELLDRFFNQARTALNGI